MSREQPQLEYEVKIVPFGNGARIKGFKAHIGLIAKVVVCSAAKKSTKAKGDKK